MKTVKTWKNDRMAFTTNWIDNVAKPTIERLTAKGKTGVLFTGIDSKYEVQLIKELLTEKSIRVNYNADAAQLSINWRNPGVDLYQVLRTLSY